MASFVTVEQWRQVAIDAPAFAYIGNNRRSSFDSLAAIAGGLIFAGKAGQAAAHEFRRNGQRHPILFDPALYMGQTQATAGLFDPVAQSVAVQQELDVAAFIAPSVMTPARRDVTGLGSILERGEAFGARARAEGIARPVFTALVVTPELITSGLEVLLELIGEHPQPMAIVPGSRFDLFDERAHVDGILACLEASPGSFMMRCDLSGLGLLAHGAASVGIGTSTSTRHRFLPMRRGARGRGDGQSPKTILIGPLMAFLRVDKLKRHEGDPVLICDCSICGGESVLRYLELGLAEEADEHTAAIWRALLNQLLGHEPHERPAAWECMCRAALEECTAFVERRSAAFEVPRYLIAWLPAH